MKFIATALALFLPICAVAADQQGIRIHNGMVNGIHYKSYDSGRRRAYLMGVIDGIFVSPLFSASDGSPMPVEPCVEGMTDLQILGIVDNYHLQHPEYWD